MIKVIEHKDKAKNKSQFDIWIGEKCHLDIKNIKGHVSFQNAENMEDIKEIVKQIKKYKV